MKEHRVIVTILIILFLYSPIVSAQNNLREKIREKVRSRLEEKAQDLNPASDPIFSFVHEGITRSYKVHFPPDYNKKISLPVPVVIFLHGGGGNMKQAYAEGVDKWSDKYGFLLVIPAGTSPFNDLFLTWNAGAWETDECCGSAVKNNIDDIGFIRRVIEEVKKKFNIDDKRIFVTGISNGGMLAYRLACELSDKIAAVAAVAPPAVPQNCKPKQPVAVMHIHGTADPCVPFKGGEGVGCLSKKPLNVQPAKDMVEFWTRQNKCLADFKTVYQKGKATCIAYENCAGESEVEFCTIESGGHTWPSGNQYFSVERIGPVYYDLSFEQIWNFFKKHPKKQL